MDANTIFLRLEGPMQAWGCNTSKLSVRRTRAIPSKSAIAGMICSALGVSRQDAANYWLPQIASLKMGLRIDREGFRWWDYHTVGAGIKVPTAEFDAKKIPSLLKPVPEELAEQHPKFKDNAILTRREYLCDASFVVALQGQTDVLTQIWAAMQKPKWQLFLGRKACTPSLPISSHQPGSFNSLTDALASVPYCSSPGSSKPDILECWLDFDTNMGIDAPSVAEISYDVPISFAPHSYSPRYIVPHFIPVDALPQPIVMHTHARWSPTGKRADYRNSEFRKVRAQRMDLDSHLCVFCKSPATTVQHISYEHAGGKERIDELATLCRLCHDAATMLEYGTGMGIIRINPSDPAWREKLLAKRAEIVRFRSATERRTLMSLKQEEE